MRALLDRTLTALPANARWLLPLFLLSLVALNVWRLPEWGPEGFHVYLTQAIMQTTLWDFGWVLLVVSYFIHQDAKKHGLTWWWIVPTFPFMPTIGLLAYFIVRERKRART